jgi:hypothetical protein
VKMPPSNSPIKNKKDGICDKGRCVINKRLVEKRTPYGEDLSLGKILS